MVRFDAALEGLGKARDQLERAAERVAGAGLPATSAASPVDDVDLSHEAVSLMEARNQYLLNLRTLKTADDLNRLTIDLLG
jgi:hypothetical protein